MAERQKGVYGSAYVSQVVFGDTRRLVYEACVAWLSAHNERMIQPTWKS